MSTTDARLRWGATALMPTPATLDLPYRIEASADGTNWGNPDAVITAVQSRLQDGSLAVVDSFGNREAPVFLRVLARNYDDLSAGEAALVAESRAQGYNTLEWTPSEAFAVPTVFDVVYGLLEFDFDDLGETQLVRRFVARLTCLPFPRSATEVITRATGTGHNTVPTTFPISNGSSATGWSGSFKRQPNDGSITTDVPMTVSVVAGAVRFTGPGFNGDNTGNTTITLTGAQNLTGWKAIVIDWASYEGVDLLGTLNGATGGLASSSPAPRAGFKRSVFRIPDGMTAVDPLRLVWYHYGGGPSQIDIDQVFLTDVIPGVGTARQLVRTLQVAGAVRTQGRLTLEHETDALGEVLCYVYRTSSAYVPSLRPYMTAGEPSDANTHTISGQQTSFDTDATFDIPAASLIAGNHRLMLSLLCRNDTVTGFETPITVTVETLVGGVVLPGSETYTETVYVPAGLDPTIVDVCGLTLPSTLLANPATATVRIRAHASDLDAAGGYHGIFFDEGWVFNLDVGTLTHVSCGTGTAAPGGPSKRLWLDPATVTNDGQDAIFRGHSADRSDAFNPAENIKGWTPPVFEPGTMTVFTVTSKAENVAVSLAHFPRFLHNAFKVEVDENGELVLAEAA